MLGYLVVAVFFAAVAAYAFWPAFRAKVDGYKTVATAALVAALGVLQQSDLTQIVGAQNVGLWLLGIGIVMAVLRVATSKSIGG
jgi:hypothetical protein